MHPESGFSNDQPIWVKSDYGKVKASAVVSDEIREDSIQSSFWENPTSHNFSIFRDLGSTIVFCIAFGRFGIDF